MEYHNSTLEFNKAFYNSHIKVINSVCKELGCEDKVDELVEKILSKEFIKIKIKKDETKPKRPRTSYMYFSEEKRGDIQKNNPELKMGGIAKKLGEMWGKVDDKEKKKYEKLAEEDKDRYEKELEEWKDNK